MRRVFLLAMMRHYEACSWAVASSWEKLSRVRYSENNSATRATIHKRIGVRESLRESFHTHQSACELSLWLLSYRCSKIDTGDGFLRDSSQ